MKFLKKIGVLVLTLIAITLITALFIKQNFVVTRTIKINQKQSVVFDYLKYVEHQSEFGVWLKKDPKAEQSFSGTDGKVGAIQKWKSQHEEVGVGEQEITGLVPDERIEFELRFLKPQEMTSTAYFQLDSEQENVTTVSWTFEGEFPYPWNFFLLFMDMDSELGPDLEQGLKNLKEIQEKED